MVNFFASLDQAPEWSYAVGLFVVVSFFLISGVLNLVKLWKSLKGAPSEPLHTPPIHTQIQRHIDESEKRIGNVIGQVKAELRGDIQDHRETMDKQIHQLHGRVSNLREENRVDLDKLGSKIDSGVKQMLEMFSGQRERIGKVEAGLEIQERRVTSHELKLDRHIEKA